MTENDKCQIISNIVTIIIKSSKMAPIQNWLKNKLFERNSGIVFDTDDLNSFSIIQDFIEDYDRQFQTPIIYYQAFPEESAIEFLNTLREELASKLHKHNSDSEQSLLDIIKSAELKTIVIDRCHLHRQDTMQNLIDFFSVCGVGVILVGCREKMEIAQILTHPKVANWDRFEVADRYEPIPELRQI